MSKNSAAYEKGREDGRHGTSNNPYHPTWDERQEYREGNERGQEEKSESEAND